MTTSPYAGRSILEIITEELDVVIDRLMTDGEPFSDGNPDVEEWKEWGEQRGQAQGLAFAIAVLENPYEMNVEKVKAEAMKRWEAAEEE